jgi:hypothetical protein
MIGACKRAWRYYYVALALSWTVSDDAPGPGSGTAIIPGKHSDTRIKPLPLTNGQGRYSARYITATPEREPVSVGEWPLHITVINL